MRGVYPSGLLWVLAVLLDGGMRTLVTGYFKQHLREFVFPWRKVLLGAVLGAALGLAFALIIPIRVS